MNSSTRFTMLVAAAAATIAAAPASARAQRNRERMRIDSTFAFDKGSWVDVSVASGEIVITGWTRSEAKVYASIERGWIDAQLSPHRITLQARSDRGRSGDTRIEIMVPIGTRVQASSASGSIRITGTDGEVEAGSASGAVEVIGATDRITVRTVSGKLHAAKLRGRTRLGTTSGTLDAEDVIGDLTATTVSGRITLSDVKSSHVSTEGVSASVTYTGIVDPSGSYEFSTHSGNVHLDIPDNSAADLSLETFSGRVALRPGLAVTLKPGEVQSMVRHGKRMEFMIGKGGAQVTVSTFSGNIIIDRGGHTDREEN
jgi:DUF4097 and DUF4098 domain-containing protein YvlB